MINDENRKRIYVQIITDILIGFNISDVKEILDSSLELAKKRRE